MTILMGGMTIIQKENMNIKNQQVNKQKKWMVHMQGFNQNQQLR